MRCGCAQASKLFRENEALADHLVAAGLAGRARLSVKGSFATGRWTQFVTLARKYRCGPIIPGTAPAWGALFPAGWGVPSPVRLGTL